MRRQYRARRAAAQAVVKLDPHLWKLCGMCQGYGLVADQAEALADQTDPTFTECPACSGLGYRPKE